MLFSIFPVTAPRRKEAGCDLVSSQNDELWRQLDLIDDDPVDVSGCAATRCTPVVWGHIWR